MSFEFEIFIKRLITLIVLFDMFISLSNSAYATPMGLKNTDTNNDGVIQHKELKKFHAIKFVKMDRDNNGYLDKKDRPARHVYERKGHHLN